MRVIVAIYTDSHAGHKWGLCPPDIVLKEEGADGQIREYTPRLTPVQETLWEIHTENVRWLKEYAGDDAVIVLQTGDPTHGTKYPDEVMTTSMYNQVRIAVGNFIPMLRIPNVEMVRVSTGTGSHEMGEGTTAYMIGEILELMFPDIDIGVVKHGLLTIEMDKSENDKEIDFSHHGPSAGIRSWTKGNVARHYARDIIEEHLKDGDIPPDVILRGHVHERVSEVVTWWRDGQPVETRMIVTPPMSGVTFFARQVARSPYKSAYGWVVLEIIDNKMSDPIFKAKTVDLRTKEKFYANKRGRRSRGKSKGKSKEV